MITPVTIKSKAFLRAPLAAITLGAIILGAMHLIGIKPAIFEGNCLEPLGLAINRWWDLPFLGLLVVYYLVGLRITQQDNDAQQEYARSGSNGIITGIIVASLTSLIRFIDDVTPQFVHGSILTINLALVVGFALLLARTPLPFDEIREWRGKAYTKDFLKRIGNKALIIGYAIGSGIFGGFMPFAATVTAVLLLSVLFMALHSLIDWISCWNLPRIKKPAWKKRLDAWWAEFDLLLLLGIVESWKYGTKNETTNPQEATS